MNLIELSNNLNGDYCNNLNGNEYETNILKRQVEFAKMFPQFVSDVKINGINSSLCCPDLEAYKTNRPKDEAFARYKTALAQLSGESKEEAAEVLDVAGRTR